MCSMKTFLRLAEFHRLVPTRGKVAAIKEWPQVTSTVEEIQNWYAEGYRSFGLITDRAAVLDFDDKELAREFFKDHQSIINTIVETKRGVHYYFRNAGHVGNAINVDGQYDIRGNNGYVICPGSVVNGWEYKFVPGYDEWNPDLLEPFRDEWLPRVSEVNTVDVSGDMVLRAREYLKTIDGAISGNKGHDRTFRAACVLVRKFRLSITQSYPLILEWNERCQPPWTGKELMHKLEDAANVENNWNC